MSESVPHESFREVMKWIRQSMARGGGNWTVCATNTAGHPFGLVAGASNVVRVPEGVILTLGFDREKLLAIRETIDLLLAGQDAGKLTVDTALVAKHDELKEQIARAGRNEPCPCGSGKKYKKCHGSSVS